MDIDRSPSPPHSQEYRLSSSNDIHDLPLSFHQQLRLETPIDNHNHRHARMEMRYTTPHKSEYTISQRSTSQQSTLSRREEIPQTKWTARKWTEMVPRTTREESDEEDTEQWESTIDQEYKKENIHSNQYQTPKRTHRTARGNKVELTPQTAFLERHGINWEPRRLFSGQSQRPRVEDSFTEMPSSHTRERNVRPSKRWSVWTQLPAIITMFGLSLIQDPITKIALSQFLVGLYDPAYQNEPFHTELQTGAGQSFTAFLNMLNRYTSVISSPPVSYFDHQHIVINGIALQWQEILRTLLFSFAVHYASRQLGRSLSTSSNPSSASDDRSLRVFTDFLFCCHSSMVLGPAEGSACVAFTYSGRDTITPHVDKTCTTRNISHMHVLRW